MNSNEYQMICFLITDQLQVTLCYQIFTEYGTLNAGTHHQTKKTVASMASAIPGIEANLAACDTASSVIEAALAATCSMDSLSSPAIASSMPPVNPVGFIGNCRMQFLVTVFLA